MREFQRVQTIKATGKLSRHRSWKNICYCLILALAVSQNFQPGFAQNPPQFSPANEPRTNLKIEQRASPLAPRVAIASFANVPILAIADSNALASDKLESSQPTQDNMGATDNQKASEPTRRVPTILGEIISVPVRLEFLVVSSMATRKALLSFNGGVLVQPTTYFDYAISNQARQIALSQFDPSVTAFLIGNDINRPNNSFFGPGLQQQNKIDETELNARLSKVWQNGLISSVGYEPSLAYLYFPQGNSGAFNPTHSSDLVTRIEQPLLRGAGRSVNLVNLRIVEWKAQQSICEIETAIQSQLRSIEEVYWRLHAEYVRLRAIDTVIALARQTLFVVKARFEVERVIYSDVARAEVKLEDLYQQRLAAELAIRDASFTLAQLSGLELDSSVLLVPTNNPELSPPEFDEVSIVTGAMSTNPNLRRQRQAVEIGRQSAYGAQNSVLPKLNLQAAHRSSGIEDDLGSSLKQMASYQFNDYTLGIQFSQQLGTRQARSQVVSSKLQIAREQALLDALERRVGFEVMQELSKLNQTYARYQSALRQVEQSKKWVDIARTRYEDPPVSLIQKESLLVTLVDYQSALQSQIDSIVLVANALADYNTSLAVIDERRGALMSKWGIMADSCDATDIRTAVRTQLQELAPQAPTEAPPPEKAGLDSGSATTVRNDIQATDASTSAPIPEAQTNFPINRYLPPRGN